MELTKSQITTLLMQAYSSWVSHWQLKMEEQRENEEIFDWLNWSLYSKKFAMPGQIWERRQIHSKKWFDVKRKESKEIFDMIETIYK